MKYLILLIVLYLVYKHLQRARLHARSQARTDSAINPQIMICCSACGVHFAQNEAHLASHGAYCCEAHLQQGPKR